MIYVGITFACTGAVADLMGLREGQQVAHLTADTSREMLDAVTAMELPPVRAMGQRTIRWRYVVTALERNRAIAQLGARVLTARQVYQLEVARAEATARIRRS